MIKYISKALLLTILISSFAQAQILHSDINQDNSSVPPVEATVDPENDDIEIPGTIWENTVTGATFEAVRTVEGTPTPLGDINTGNTLFPSCNVPGQTANNATCHQIIEASVTGEIQSVTMRFDAQNDSSGLGQATVSIHNGGSTSDAILATVTRNDIPNGASSTTFTFPVPAPVVGGGLYTISLFDPDPAAGDNPRWIKGTNHLPAPQEGNPGAPNDYRFELDIVPVGFGTTWQPLDNGGTAYAGVNPFVWDVTPITFDGEVTRNAVYTASSPLVNTSIATSNLEVGEVYYISFVCATGSTTCIADFASNFKDQNGEALPSVELSVGQSREYAFISPNGIDLVTYEVAGGGLETVRIDASASAQNLTFPAATGSQDAILYTLVDKTNTADITVQSGEELNGVVDATFTFSAYGEGAQFLATDRSTGNWDISVIGAAEQTDLHYGHVTFPGSQSILFAGNIVSFNTQVLEFGLIVNTTNNEIEITQSGRYQIEYSGLNANVTSSVQMDIHVNGVQAFNGQNRPASSSGDTFVYNINTDLDLVAGDKITIVHASDNVTSLRGSSLMVRQFPTTESILAGMVQAERLHYSSLDYDFTGTSPVAFQIIPLSSINANVENVSNVGAKLDFGDPTARAVDHVGSMLDVTNDQFVIINSGLYEINASYLGEGSSSRNISAQLILNGTTVLNHVTVQASTGSTFSDDRYADVSWTGSLSSGDTIDMRAFSNNGLVSIFDAHMAVHQLPETTVVNPDSLEVEDLNSAVANSTSSTGVIASATPEDLTYDEFTSLSGGITESSGTFTLPQSDIPYNLEAQLRFDVDAVASSNNDNITVQWVDSSNVAIGSNNVVAFAKSGADSSEYLDEIGQYARTIVDASAGAVTVKLRATTELNGLFEVSRVAVKITQLSNKSVINNNNVEVNDQGTSGYLDIGTTRMQWGITANLADNAIQALIVPFANPTYTVQLTNFNGFTNRLGTVSIQTENDFRVNSRTIANNTTTNGRYHWFAIGEKP